MFYVSTIVIALLSVSGSISLFVPLKRESVTVGIV